MLHLTVNHRRRCASGDSDRPGTHQTPHPTLCSAASVLFLAPAARGEATVQLRPFTRPLSFSRSKSQPCALVGALRMHAGR